MLQKGKFGAHLSLICCIAICATATQHRVLRMAICLTRPRSWLDFLISTGSAAENVAPPVKDIGLPGHGSVTPQPAGAPVIIGLIGGPGDDPAGHTIVQDGGFGRVESVHRTQRGMRGHGRPNALPPAKVAARRAIRLYRIMHRRAPAEPALPAGHTPRKSRFSPICAIAPPHGPPNN